MCIGTNQRLSRKPQRDTHVRMYVETHIKQHQLKIFVHLLSMCITEANLIIIGSVIRLMILQENF